MEYTHKNAYLNEITEILLGVCLETKKKSMLEKYENELNVIREANFEKTQLDEKYPIQVLEQELFSKKIILIFCN